jgi:hypothetical protein
MPLPLYGQSLLGRWWEFQSCRATGRRTVTGSAPVVPDMHSGSSNRSVLAVRH